MHRFEIALHRPVEVGKASEVVAKPAFEVGPGFFDGIKIGAVRRQKQHISSMPGGNFEKLLFSMKCSVVHDYQHAFWEHGQQLKLEPILKKPRLCRVTVTLHSNVPAAPQSRDDICTLKFLSGSDPVYPDASRGAGVNPLIIGI